jgi:hypothetical protein
MKVWLALSALVLGGGYSTFAAAGCDNPSLVMIPATGEKMSKKEEEKAREKATEAAQKYFTAMQSYVSCIQAEIKPQVPACDQAAAEEYGECLHKELEAAGDSPSVLPLRVLLARNNAAVAEAQAVQKWFAAAFGAAQQGPPAGLASDGPAPTPTKGPTGKKKGR